MRLTVLLLTFLAFVCTATKVQGQDAGHPNTALEGWNDLLAPDLSNAVFEEGVWFIEDGLLTASEDSELWTTEEYGEFELDLEFRNASGANSGVFIFADIDDWVPHSIEIQIADDFHEMWAGAPDTWKCGAIFGHVPPRTSAVNPPGEWNRMTIISRDRRVEVILNGEPVSEMDMDRWTSSTTNPDGSEIPEWLSIPKAELPATGRIGFQGRHGEASVWFRNIRIRTL
jgi:hypothetical protein